MADPSVVRTLFSNRWRTFLAAALGAAAGWLARSHGVLSGASFLIGWNTAALVFLLPTGWILITSDAQTVRRHAKAEDENKAVIMTMVLATVAASLAAIVIALKESKLGGGGGGGGQGHGEPPWVTGLSVLTLALSWLVVQSLYTLHYTHRYFGDRDDDGQPDGGIDFPGAKPTTYRDFIYVSICIGATCQVSDFDITSSTFRNLVTTHALISFVFNTMVLALGINIIATLMGQ